MKTYYSIMPASYYSILEIKANKPYDEIDSILGSRDGNKVLPADTKFRIMQGKRATPMIFYHESISIKFFSQKFIQFLSQFIDMSDKCYPIEIEDFDETYYVIYNQIDEIILPLDDAWAKDCARWNTDSTQTVQLRADRIKTALQRNIEWFNNHLPASPYASIDVLTEEPTDKTAIVYNLQGICIGKYKTKAEAIRNLGKGIYIINHQKIVIR